MKYTMLAANPRLYKILFDDDQDENVPKDEEVEWITPQSFEEIDALEKLLSSIDDQVGREESISGTLE
jgi:hypothetical protein